MKNNIGWTSEFRRKKFEKRYNRDKTFDYTITELDCESKIPKTIAVMLDIEGTCDDIDDEKAELFIKGLEVVRKKFGAEYGTISISTHYNNTQEMRRVLNIIARNLLGNIKIGISFFYGGEYDFEHDKELMRHPDFNRDKPGTFMSYYVNNIGINNLWFALIDDNIPEYVYKRCKESHPVLIAKPSCRERDLSKNSFVRRTTMTSGIDGVLEIMGDYLEDIGNMTVADIVTTQENMIMHLSSYELVDKITNREYGFLKRYFEEGYADEDDYEDALGWLIMLNRNRKLDKDELVELNEIFRLIGKYFQDKGLKSQENRTMAFQNTLRENMNKSV